GSLLSSGDTEYVTPARVSVPPVLEEHLPLRGWPDLDLQRAADRIVLARFTPPGLIIDEQLNVLQVRGQTASFIQLPAGSVTWNLLRLLREEVAHQVRSPIERAIRDNVPVIIENVTTREGSAEVEIQVDVLPITALATRTRCFLILFQAARSHTHLPQLPSLPLLSPTESESLSVQLRRDLESTRLHLQSLVEERDIHNQELVSANEEIQSANEELQSSNEELETTKEELQSSNEELQTVNEELQQRNLVLLQTGNDLSNLLTSVNIPLLMLTSDLEIRQFTPPMQRLLNIRPSDVGRSISEIRLQISIENIEPLLHDVLETLGTREVEVTDRDGRWHLLRIRPYRTAENRIEGLVVVLVDIHQLRSSQQELSDARDFASSVVESVPVAIVVINRDCTIRSVNTAFRELTRMPNRELIGQSLPDMVGHLWGMDGFLDKLHEIMGENHITGVLEFEHVSTTARPLTLLIKAQALLSDSNQVVLLALEDITTRRAAEHLLADQQHELERKIESAARTLDQTQEELRGLTSHLFNAQEEERQHVARELHDDVSQRLSLLELMLESAQASPTSTGRLAEIETLRSQLQSLNTDVRQISHRLHPAILTDLGLASALRALVDEFGRREAMPVTFVSVNVPELPPQPATTALYRIAQEALRNVVKHAGKTHVKVLLEGTAAALHLEILDLGQGFDPETEFTGEGLGLVSMKERARLAGGNFSITSALGRGTTVAVDVPLDHHA
ncbi:MAG TPA: PAS domain-containing protein, partial [Edaphobacter sp.]